jgi:hypothetical protein
VDFGIPIDFPEEFGIHARTGTPDPKRPYWALGRIRYSCVDDPTADDADRWKSDGILLYIKPGIYGGEPGDVFNYAAENPAFPHESTADQFFSESQFESYRALGRHVVETINERVPLAQLFDRDWQSKQLRYWDRDRGVAGGNYPTPSTGVSRV